MARAIMARPTPPNDAALQPDADVAAYEALPADAPPSLPGSELEPAPSPAPFPRQQSPEPPLLTPSPQARASFSVAARRRWELAAQLATVLTVVAPAVAVGRWLLVDAEARRGSEAAGERALLGMLILLYGGLGGVMVTVVVAPSVGAAIGAWGHRAVGARRAAEPVDAAA